jgi:hypothetical protein
MVKRNRSKKTVINVDEKVDMFEEDPDMVEDSDLDDAHMGNMYNFALDQ